MDLGIMRHYYFDATHRRHGVLCKLVYSQSRRDTIGTTNARQYSSTNGAIQSYSARS